jgi:hypothetical protein
LEIPPYPTPSGCAADHLGEVLIADLYRSGFISKAPELGIMAVGPGPPSPAPVTTKIWGSLSQQP